MKSKSPLILGLLVVAAAISILLWISSVERESEPAPSEPPATSMSADPTSEVAGGEPRENREGADAPREVVPESKLSRPARAVSMKTAKPEPAVSITGKVIDDEGAPVHSFEISYERAGKKARSAWSITPPKRDRFESEQGEFQVHGLQPSEWVLRAHAMGGTSNPAVVEVPQLIVPLVIVLPRSADVRGLVLTTDGTPVWNAKIYSWKPGEQEPSLHMGGDPEPGSSSDTAGRFGLKSVQPGEVRLLASREGLCDSEWTAVITAPAISSEVVLRMRQGGRVIGRIDESKGTVVGRELTLLSFSGHTGWRETLSDLHGTFAFENVVPQRYIIQLSEEAKPAAPDGSWSSPLPQVRRPISVEEGGTTEVIFGPDRSTIRVLGLVTCDGVPLAGLEVEAQSEERTEDADRRVKTDASGRFELGVSGPRIYQFWIRDGDSHTVVALGVEDRDPCELAFELPGGVVRGVLRSSSGKPLSRTGLTILRDVELGEDERQSFVDRYRRTQTGIDGSFEFKFLRPGLYCLRAPDGYRGDSPPLRTAFGRVVIKDIRVGAGALDAQVLQLLREGFIRGRVLDGSGAGVAGARVKVFDTTGCGLSATWDISSDATGSFEVDSLAPGSYTVGARNKETYGPRVPAEVVEGKTTQITLEIP